MNNMTSREMHEGAPPSPKQANTFLGIDIGEREQTPIHLNTEDTVAGKMDRIREQTDKLKDLLDGSKTTHKDIEDTVIEITKCL